MIPAAAVTGLSRFFKSTVDGLDKLNDMSDARGASVVILPRAAFDQRTNRMLPRPLR